MIFDLERYIDEPLVYFDDKRKIDDQKVFLLGMRIRTDGSIFFSTGSKPKILSLKNLILLKTLASDL